MNNVKTIGRDCTACGICSTICPKSCINFSLNRKDGNFAISVDESICIDCGKCQRVCPVLNTNIICEGSTALGRTKAVYAVHSKNAKIRKHAASGGFITSFLCYLLENGKCDGVLISHRNGVIGQSFIARSSEEIVASKTSIYAPVDYANGVEELLNTDCKRIAVVGLPCQIQAISNLEKINKNIANKVILKISILCGKTPTIHAYRYIAKVAGFEYENIRNVCNRGDGWPGNLKITYLNGEFKVPYKSLMSMGMLLSSPYLCNRGCLSCVDGVGLSADMVVCDAWTQKYTCQENDGWNFVLTKSDKADSLLHKVGVEQYLYIENEEIGNFYKANKRVINKGIIGNSMRLNNHKIKNVFANPSLKYKVHIVLLKLTTHLFRPEKITKQQLIIGKVINKLKD